MALKKEELIREYTKAIREGTAAVFGGAGLSRASGFVNWKELLRPLAKDILEDVGIVVFIFGNKKIKDASGKEKVVDADGCIQEFEIAKSLNRVVIPIGSTGYASRKIFDEIKGNISDYPYLINFIDRLGIETDPDKLVSIVIEIVNSFAD